MSHLPRKDNKGMYYYGKTPFISRCQDSDGAQWTNKIFSLFILFQMSGRGNGVWSLAGEIILRNYKSWKVEWSPLESKLWLFRVITWHFCLSVLYLVQTGFSRQNKWRLNGDLSLLHILQGNGDGRNVRQTQQLGSFQSTPLSSPNHLSSFVPWQPALFGPLFKLTAADF